MWLRLLPRASASFSCVWPNRSINCLKPGSLFHRVQVGALNVLDNCDFQNFGIVKIAYNNRDFVQLCHLGRAPTALTGYDFILLPPFNGFEQSEAG